MKIVVPGNHELGFEDGEEMAESQLAALEMLGLNKPYELLSNCTYLCDRQIDVRRKTFFIFKNNFILRYLD